MTEEPFRCQIVDWAMVPVDQLLANPKNYRRHPNKQRDALRGSLRELGIIDRVLVNKRTGYVLDGHARIEEYLSAGVPEAPVLFVDIPEEQEGLAILSLDPIAAMATADKDVLADILRGAKTQEEGLAAHLKEMALQFGIALEAEPVKPDPGAQIEKADELQEKWKVERGQLWQVGAHHILCGDATEPANYALLLDGRKADMVFTDPPYNVDYANSAKDKLRGKDRPILNDNLGAGFGDFLLAALTPTLVHCQGALYVCMSSSELHVLQAAFRAAGGHWSTFIIWAKNAFTMGRADYQRQYEPILYGWPEGAKHHWCGDRNQGDVWQIAKPSHNDLHPTMKPLELVQRATRNSSREGGIILDPFLGSGTTAVVAEQTGRVCFGMELEPKYVAVTLERLAGMGLEPVLAAPPE